MNKVHPDKPSKLYKNKTASLHSSGRGSSCEERVAPDSNEEFTVLSNSLSGLGGFKSGIKSQGGGVEEVAVKDQFELEEERLQELKEDSDNEELVRHAEHEEGRFLSALDQNYVVETEIDEAMRHEEGRLAALQTSRDSEVVSHHTAAQEEEDRLLALVVGASEDLSHSVGADQDEERVEELLRARAETERGARSVGSEEGDQFDETRVNEDRALIVRNAVAGEDEHTIQMRNLLKRHDTSARLMTQSHSAHRDAEEARIAAEIARSEEERRQEAALLRKQNAGRRHLAPVVEKGKVKKGKVQLQSKGGMFRYNMADEANFSMKNNHHALPEEFALAQQRKRHLQHTDCVLDRTVGRWDIDKESELMNVVDRVQTHKSFVDGTGRISHTASNDCVLENAAREYRIPLIPSFGSGAKKHVHSRDAHLENVRKHDLNLEFSIVHRTRGHHLCKEGVFVQRAHKMHIPLPNTTKMLNKCTHYIPAGNSVVHRTKGLKLYMEGVIVQKSKRYSLCDTGRLVQKGMGFSVATEGSQDAQSRKYTIPTGGSQDKNSPSYFVPEGSLIHNIKGSSIPRAGPGDNQNRTWHHQADVARYKKPWKKSRFSIPLEGSLRHNTRFVELFMDASWSPCNNDFQIADGMDIDDDYLNEDYEDEE